VALALLREPDGGRPEVVAVGRPPTFLLPAGRRAAVAMCVAHNGLRSRRRQAARLAAALTMALGLPRLLGDEVEPAPPDDLRVPSGLLPRLSELLGGEICVGVGLGRLDPFWKPVLQLFDPRGHDLAFAKVGWTPLTCELVRNEAEHLGRLDGGRGVVITPRLLHSFDHDGLQVVVTAPLPRRAHRWASEQLPAPPDSLVALGAEGPAPLGGLAWWQEVRHRVDAGAERAGAPQLPELVDAVGARLGDRPLAVGLQHGDWVPWNLASLHHEPRPVVWDWEYGRLHAPVGVDLVHGRYQSERLLRGAPATVAFGRAHRGCPVEVALLHAAMIAGRRCWVASFDASPADADADADADDELTAAVAVLQRHLSIADGPG
jgi:hypothetical protein